MQKIITILIAVLSLFPSALLAQNLVRPAAGQCIDIPSCSKIDSLVQLALTKKGKPYVRAGSGPNSFDCSGFTMWVYKQFGIDLPHGSVTQFKVGKKVERKDIRPGDLVFFYRSRCVGHVGLVTEVDSAGNVTFIHASTYKTGVKIDHLESNWYAKTFCGTRRIFECADDTTSRVPVVFEPDTIAVSVADTVAASPAAPPAPTCIVHRVQKGETLYAISKKYGVTVNEIQSWNHLPSPDKLSIGQSLKIYKRGTVAAANAASSAPSTPSAPAPKPVYHKIKAGETLGSIAAKYHTTVSKLQKLNKMGNSTFLREGKTLRVK